jgi:hypothetical protein
MNNHKNTTEEIYDVSKYNDFELFQILDLNNPSDRELEAKIQLLINKYQTMQNESGHKLARFFHDIYDHFFEDIDEDSKEVAPANESSAKDAIIENEDNMNPEPANVPTTKTVDYTKDSLNPLLKQTIRRIISIDSQYRDNKSSLATDFTFNLSDPLKDVVSLKLYSVQIPYTWYTINKNYGSNFFYLKGNSPGNNNGYNDYKIAIAPGNYTPKLLITEINTAITTLSNTYIDASFGTSTLTYNESTCKATMKMDIFNLYNETNYYLYFPNWSSPLLDISRNYTLAGFFGYNTTSYSPRIAYSYRTIPFADDANFKFYLDQSNNYFTIIQYVGTSEYTEGSSEILNTITITSSLDVNAAYSRNEIVNNFNTQLQSNIDLSGSEIFRIKITDTAQDGYENSYFKFVIDLNRMVSANNPCMQNTKTVVIFPQENTYTLYKNVWNGNNSCFQFNSHTIELNNIVAETKILQSNFVINSTPYITLKCITDGYSSTDSFTQNDYIFYIENSNNYGYSLTEYISAINTSLISTNNDTIDDNHPNGVFNVTSSNITGGIDIINSKTFVNYTSSNHKINFQFNVCKLFDTSMYTIDLSGTALYNKLGFNNQHNINLSDDTVFSSIVIGKGNNWDLEFTNNPILMYIKSNSDANYGNQNANWFTVKTPDTKNMSVAEMQTAINTQFTDFSYNGLYPLKNSYIKISELDSSRYECELVIEVNYTLLSSDYRVVFTDPSSNEFENINNSWYNNLQLEKSTYTLSDYILTDVSYSYVDSYANIYNSANIDNSGILLNHEITLIDGSNNYFYIKPRTDAYSVYNSKGYNDISFNIPAGTYTHNQLFAAINTLFSNNSLTVGSSVGSFTQNSKIYIKFRLNINKKYTTKDYRLVFYDPISFVKCYVGTTSVRNTNWDTTVGWILGFRAITEYDLTIDYQETDVNSGVTYYTGTSSEYTYDQSNNIMTIIGDTSVSVNLYNYFLIGLDDYTQNHLNDGLVTITSAENDITLPSYANRSTITCDPVTNAVVYSGESTSNTNSNNKTLNQIYSANQVIAARKNKAKIYSSGPFVKDIFGLIPMKTSGLAPGSVYVEFGGTLQNQERLYFGPVNIRRMAVRLMNDRGDVVDLNGANWSFSLMCEQLYQQKSI